MRATNWLTGMHAHHRMQWRQRSVPPNNSYHHSTPAMQSAARVHLFAGCGLGRAHVDVWRRLAP